MCTSHCKISWFLVSLLGMNIWPRLNKQPWERRSYSSEFNFQPVLSQLVLIKEGPKKPARLQRCLSFWAVQRRAYKIGSLKAHLSIISGTQNCKDKSNLVAAVRFSLRNSDVEKKDTEMELNIHIKTQIRIYFFSASTCFFHNSSCSQFDSVPVQN